jgi:hypothetical protein
MSVFVWESQLAGSVSLDTGIFGKNNKILEKNLHFFFFFPGAKKALWDEIWACVGACSPSYCPPKLPNGCFLCGKANLVGPYLWIQAFLEKGRKCQKKNAFFFFFLGAKKVLWDAIWACVGAQSPSYAPPKWPK